MANNPFAGASSFTILTDGTVEITYEGGATNTFDAKALARHASAPANFVQAVSASQTEGKRSPYAGDTNNDGLIGD